MVTVWPNISTPLHEQVNIINRILLWSWTELLNYSSDSGTLTGNSSTKSYLNMQSKIDIDWWQTKIIKRKIVWFGAWKFLYILETFWNLFEPSRDSLNCLESFWTFKNLLTFSEPSRISKLHVVHWFQKYAQINQSRWKWILVFQWLILSILRILNQWETMIHFPLLSDLSEHSFGISGPNVARKFWA